MMGRLSNVTESLQNRRIVPSVVILAPDTGWLALLIDSSDNTHSPFVLPEPSLMATIFSLGNN
jgi:hypothetical protein